MESASLPLQKRRRLLPIRKGQYERRFVHDYLRLPERGYFEIYFHDDGRQYWCFRQLLLRRWLAQQLEFVNRLNTRHPAYITGNEYDIELFQIKNIPHDDAVMFDFFMPETIQPTPQLLRWGQRLNKPWDHAQVRAQFLNEKYDETDASKRMTRSRAVVHTPFLFPYQARDAVQRLMCPPDAPAQWKVGLFILVPGHTFAVIVSLIRRETGCFIDDILVLDTAILKRGESSVKQKREDIAIAVALHSVSSHPENIFDLVQRVRRPVTDGPTTLLQENEGDDGFCQHWNTYFLYQILVRHEDPTQMYERLIAMGPRERWDLIVEFANDAVTLPVQPSNA
jgi:hypothetical protein